MATPRFLPVLGALLLLLSGCVGSPEPYHPGYQPRPTQETVESAEERAKRLAVPVEIDREDTYLTHSRKEIGRVMGDVPRNPWNSYEWELDDTLNYYVPRHGKEFGARPILGRYPAPRANEARKVEDGAAGGAESGSGESGGDEGGGADEYSEDAEDYGY